ncbi:hypothetical protein Tco_0704270 [Tanacetum coccineum]|uniref:Integrase, catalytic region, zinc finger, CCHC-type, peptidase aspartic, catalytic n=1 Tax=Tanacetum coccineum TaxID=301880 RepID=A0ABQ4Y1A0_9ASTR
MNKRVDALINSLRSLLSIQQRKYRWKSSKKNLSYNLQKLPRLKQRYSRLMDEFDKFAVKEDESLEYVYERLTMLVNIMDRNNVRPILVSIKTKFLNCLQLEWSKYVTMVRHNQTGDTVSYDQLYDSLVQFEPHVQASKAKRAAKNHDPLALIAHSNASPSHYHASSSYSHSPQPYYVTHPSLVVDYEEYYQGELQGDSQKDKLTTAMMLLDRAITQKFSTPTNNRLRTSSNIRNQAVIQDGRVDIQTKNARYGGNGNRNAGRQNRNQAFNAGMGMMKVIRLFSVFHELSQIREREQMLLAMKDEAGSNIKDEENDFMLDNSYGYETLEELTAVVIMMVRIQPADDNAVTEPNYDAKAVSEVNAAQKFYKADVIPMPVSLSKTLKELQQELIEEVQEIRENIKLEYQKLFNSIKATWTQHQHKVDELIEHVNQNTYAYGDVSSQNQYLLMTMSELKNKLKTIEKGKNMNTKFDKSKTLGKPLCVTPLNTSTAVKAKKMSNTKVNADRSKPVTLHSRPKNEQSQKQSANVIARGMYRITKTEKHTLVSKTNMNVSNSTRVESSNSVRRPTSKDTKSKNRVLKNTNDKSSSIYVRKVSSSVSIDSNKHEIINLIVCQSNVSVLNTKTVDAVNDGSNIVSVS